MEFIFLTLKQNIKNRLKQYSVSGINPEIVDLKILYVELDSSIYYNYSLVETPDDLKTKIISNLNQYSQSSQLNSFGGRWLWILV